MRLSTFILDNMESILQTWEAFARSVETPNRDLSANGLRNHAEHILRTVAQDMRTPQTEQQQIAKSHGLGPSSSQETAAQTHAVLRLIDGFTLDQMVSEYRALRSSVLRLWLARDPVEHSYQVDDMIRFNEAIDQALVESIGAYGQEVESTRKTVLGVLGHDLRSPLTAVLMGSSLLSKSPQLTSREKDVATQIATSAQRANQMVKNLLDLAHCNLGTGIPIVRAHTELNQVCKAVIEEIKAGNPGLDIVQVDERTIAGAFDGARMSQVFSNLIGNAVRHGQARQPIKVLLSGDGERVILEVHNFGEPIPASALPSLFSPKGRYTRYTDKQKKPTGLGLGLFIVSEIVAGHGGHIEVESSHAQGTRFRVIMPTG
ncbi:sensor histidine kinase [Pseudomonas guariconensis]|uniref:sensor histidine kinase n=1 Tax=Pseudomonas guariconensis TaxID=1288410 RepID=UPI0018AA9472|nr:sensor histidine kinase [Pseudomonas guariconensis]MBF8720165.1 sensor histidine kinase [Pseudomonas guariconensis]MBF8792716.1 sensor histidine kinase [Pseudomonas monteilii]